MGIPSYYKRLVDTIGGLISKTHPGTINWLWMDFNCMIYHCLRRHDTPPYPGDDKCAEWESEFIECIVRYLIRVYSEVKPTNGIYIAIDGVVPMAKMRQQRLRRFKSVWLAENGLIEGLAPGQMRWDTNAITPGTEFMEKLGRRLATLTKEKGGGITWELSSSNDPGEGEHKIMEQWRSGKYKGNHAVYGLDADLIVLSLLNGSKLGGQVWLFREDIEMGVIVRDAVGEESYSWFSIDLLRAYLEVEIGEHTIQDYCFAMSFLGNDFLPSSLSFKMRENGHECLLQCLGELKEKLVNEDGKINSDALSQLIQWLAKDEEDRILEFIMRKLGRGRFYDSLPIGDNNWPLAEKAEKILLDSSQKKLRLDWKDIYNTQWLGGSDIRIYSNMYIYGIYWVWAYYNGEMDKVCYNWCYPFGMPPLWSWIQDSLTDTSDDLRVVFPGKIRVHGKDILPQEQLALVLPLQSWGLLGVHKQRLLFEKAPWLFPTSFGFDSVGKRYFWECEAEIPVPTILEVKGIIS